MLKKTMVILLMTVLPGILRAESVKLWRTITGHTTSVSAVAFSPDSKQLATAGFDAQVKTWNVIDGKPVLSMAHGAIIESIVYSPDGKYLVSAARDKTVKLWDAKDGRLIKTFANPSDMVFSIAFSPDSDFLAAGSLKKADFWEIKNMKNSQSINVGNAWVRSVKFSPDGKYLLLTAGNKVSVWEADYGNFISLLTGKGGLAFKNERVFEFGAFIYAADFSRDSQYFAVTGDDGTVKVWRTEDGLPAWQQQAHNGVAWSLSFSPSYLATAGKDKIINFFDIKTGKALLSAPGCGDEIFGITFSADGKYLAAACREGTALVYRLENTPFVLTWKIKVMFYAAGALSFIGLVFVLFYIFRKKQAVKDWKV